ncbi:hypothetical protein [Acetobacterium tundrae]|uniref:Uncharacterized protein n=1 Tax=Acetobacterium tundrae TaxID=132932 RepID=A0ABR6WP94_9FIRM|nr:hypothetical protein [Acetobacterium tundrae]MBC3798232.1 hypothetical protein [Acetobacterium tundrae]
MKKNMRKETKIGILLLVLFNIINFIATDISPEIPMLHFLRGGLAGLSLCQIVIGILPETAYLKLKNF